MSPPTKLRLRASKSAGVVTARARTRSRKPGREALDLRLDRVGQVAAPAVRDVAVRPGGVLPLGRAGRVEQRVLGEKHERPLGRPARPRGALGGGDLVERAAEVDGRGAGALGRAPRDRPVERPVELERARAVPVAGEAAVVALRKPGDPAELRRGRRRRGRPRRRGSSSTGLDACTVSSAASASAIACAPPRGKPQPATWPSTASAIPKPALGRRSSGSIECAARPAKSARARSVANSRLRERAGVAQRGDRRRGEPRPARHERAAAAGTDRGRAARPPPTPSTIGSTARGRRRCRRRGRRRRGRARARPRCRRRADARRRQAARPTARPAPPSGRRARRAPSGGSPSRGRGGSPAASARRCARRRRSRPPPRRPRPRAPPASASARPRARSAPSRRRLRQARRVYQACVSSSNR